MPRKPRVWYPGAIYHVTCRGNHKNEIFGDDEDRRVYLNRLHTAAQDHACTILSYCLMTNHVHLHVETSHIELWRMMKQLNMMYAIFFNKKYELVGHLFQGRYKAELVTDDEYNIKISRYVHLNPVKAEMVAAPLDYTWSSYRDYVGGRTSVLVAPERILRYFRDNPREEYRRYVES